MRTLRFDLRTERTISNFPNLIFDRKWPRSPINILENEIDSANYFFATVTYIPKTSLGIFQCQRTGDKFSHLSTT